MSKQIPLLILSIIFIAFGLLSCTSETKPVEEAADTAAAEDKVTAPPAATPPTTSSVNSQYLIENTGIEGILVGGAIEKIKARTKAGQTKNSKGKFPIYHFGSKDGNDIGHFLQDPRNESLIGDIIITSPNAVTSHGLKVGSTFAELQAAAPNLVVHGSEPDGHTTAIIGNLKFLLRAAFRTYEVDEAQIEPDTKIARITIMRQARK